MEPGRRVRINQLGLSTGIGLLLARIGSRGERVQLPTGELLVGGWLPKLPPAYAFTIGDVVLTRGTAAEMLAAPQLLGHERHHSVQWACCGGSLLVYLPLYWFACGWSWLRTGDRSSRNPFEVRAGLQAGNYLQLPVRRGWPDAGGLTPERPSVT